MLKVILDYDQNYIEIGKYLVFILFLYYLQALDEGNLRQYQSLPRGISISGKRLKKLPATARKNISSPERLPG